MFFRKNKASERQKKFEGKYLVADSLKEIGMLYGFKNEFALDRSMEKELRKGELI